MLTVPARRPWLQALRLSLFAGNMFTARKKIVKERGVEPDELEEQVAQVNNTWSACLTERAAAQD